MELASLVELIVIPSECKEFLEYQQLPVVWRRHLLRSSSDSIGSR